MLAERKVELEAKTQGLDATDHPAHHAAFHPALDAFVLFLVGGRLGRLLFYLGNFLGLDDGGGCLPSSCGRSTPNRIKASRSYVASVAPAATSMARLASSAMSHERICRKNEVVPGDRTVSWG